MTDAPMYRPDQLLNARSGPDMTGPLTDWQPAADQPVEGAVVPSPAAEVHYQDPDQVTRIVIRVERADGSIVEYEAAEPWKFEISDPMSFASLRLASRIGVQPAGQPHMVTVQQATPSLSVSFQANPQRGGLHIRNVRRPS